MSDLSNEENKKKQDLIALLNNNHSWPCDYAFKLIVPTQNLADVLTTLTSARLTKKPSTSGKYTSITAHKMVSSADDVLSIYADLSHIDNVITL